MGYIYKITNKLNNKSYIGQTGNTIKDRMKKHYSNAKVAKTGIDYAIGKYGRDNFIVEEVCTCDNSQLDELERYYIQYYNTYNDGYNLTIGGQDYSSRPVLDEPNIIQDYLNGATIADLQIKYNCGYRAISSLLHRNNIEMRHCNNEQNLLLGKKFKEGDGVKPVYIKELDLTFPSLKECAQWLINNKYSKANSMEMARKSLSRVLNGERQTYCKLHFSFV